MAVNDTERLMTLLEIMAANLKKVVLGNLASHEGFDALEQARLRRLTHLAETSAMLRRRHQTPKPCIARATQL